MALLKGRFRRLKFLETVRHDLAVMNIVAACILHNVCILKGDLLDDINVDGELNDEGRYQPNNYEDLDPEEAPNNAIRKRSNIVNSLPLIIRE